MKSLYVLMIFVVSISLYGCRSPEPKEQPKLQKGDIAPVHYEQIIWRGGFYDVVRVNLNRADVHLFWDRPDSAGRFGSFDALRGWLEGSGRKVYAITNAGIFLKGYIPEGILVGGGRRYTQLNRSNGWGNFYLKPNGVFAITSRGAIVASTTHFADILGRDTVFEATQSGPMLVAHGMIHPVFEDSSYHYNIRSGVAAPTPDEVVLVISRNEVTLYSMASFFLERLNCTDALYLDGDITRMYAPELGRFDNAQCAAMIAVVAKPLGKAE
jgi:uncharacterized protein YigE (DUF2233 family)